MVSYHPQSHLHDITDNTFISVAKLKIGMKSIIKYCTIKETIYLLRGKRFRQLERVTLLAACFTAEFSFCFLDEHSRVFTIRYQEKKERRIHSSPYNLLACMSCRQTSVQMSEEEIAITLDV